MSFTPKPSLSPHTHMLPYLLPQCSMYLFFSIIIITNKVVLFFFFERFPIFCFTPLLSFCTTPINNIHTLFSHTTISTLPLYRSLFPPHPFPPTHATFSSHYSQPAHIFPHTPYHQHVNAFSFLLASCRLFTFSQHQHHLFLPFFFGFIILQPHQHPPNTRLQIPIQRHLSSNLIFILPLICTHSAFTTLPIQ